MDQFKYDYAVIGGDMRQVYLVNELLLHGFSVCHYALCQNPGDICAFPSPPVPADSLKEAVSYAKCIVCPIPLSKNHTTLNLQAEKEPVVLSHLLQCLQDGQHFFAGCVPAAFVSEAKKKGASVSDLMADEGLAIYNSIATAEGAIAEAVLRSPLNLHGSRTAVLGYGRCGRTLALRLKGMAANVSVFVNNPVHRGFAGVAADVAAPVSDFPAAAQEFDFVFNTIPSLFLTEEILHTMKKHVTIIDIASAPGGVNFEAAKRLGITAALCLSLPGKYAPASSAAAIADTVIKYFRPGRNQKGV